MCSEACVNILAYCHLHFILETNQEDETNDTDDLGL